MNGTINVTGLSGVGKTTFAIECGAPFERIAYLNFDVKQPAYKDQLGAYKSFNAQVLPFLHNGKVDPHMKMVDDAIDYINNLDRNKIDVIILDAWEMFQKALGLYVIKNMGKFRKNFHASSGQIRVAEEKGYGVVVEAGLFAYMQEIATKIFVINHVKPKWENSKRTDKLIPVASSATIQKTVARFWITETIGHQCPTALVVKNHAIYKYVEGIGNRTLKLFPEVLSPLSLPGYQDMEYISLWDVINYYIDNPVGNRELSAIEKFSDAQRNLISEAIVTSYTQEEVDEYEMQALESKFLNNQEFVNAVLNIKDKSPVLIWKNVKPDFPQATVNIIESVLAQES